MPQCRESDNKRNKINKLDFSSLLNPFKVLASLTGSIFIVSCVLALISKNEEETRVIYAMILIINLVICACSILIIKYAAHYDKKASIKKGGE